MIIPAIGFASDPERLERVLDVCRRFKVKWKAGWQKDQFGYPLMQVTIPATMKMVDTERFIRDLVEVIFQQEEDAS